MNAYDSTYVAGAQQRLGAMLDYGTNYLQCDLNEFYQAFLDSTLSSRFAAGDPAIIAGRSGSELAIETATMLSKLSTAQKIASKQTPPPLPYEASEEYWTGWALAFYQWASGYTFSQIEQRVPIVHVRTMYSPYHEMDIRQFCNKMDELAHAAHPTTNLQAKRLSAGLSQSQLAHAAGVPVRTLQQYEQRQKDINHARADYVVQLSRVLACTPADLLEHCAAPSYDYAFVSMSAK